MKTILWLVMAMRTWVPFLAGRNVEAETARYTAIAEDAWSVVEKAPRLFAAGTEDEARRKAAIVLLAIGSYESQFDDRVDAGKKRGDNGHSVCLNQVLFPTAKHRIVVTAKGGWEWAKEGEEGWSREDVAADRTKCFAASLAIVRVSLRACGNLSVYTCGHCDDKEPFAKHRLGRAKNWIATHAFE